MEPARPARPSTAVLVAVGVLAAAWYAVLRDRLVDDACIQLRYAETLATSGRWGFYPERATNTATSPLNVALLAVARLVTGSPELAAAGVAAASAWTVFAAAWRLAARAGLPPLVPWAALAVLAANPLLCSTVGMESFPFAALLWAAAAMTVERRPVATGVAAGLLALARPDGALLVPLAAFALRTERAGFRRTLAGCAAVVLPWTLASWTLLGSAVPDTFFLKRAQTWGGGLTYASGGAAYARVFPLAVAASLVALPFAVAALRHRGPAASAVRMTSLFAVAHAAAYAAMGVPPYHWYYAPALVAGGLAGAVGIALCAASERGAARAAAAAGCVACTAGAAVSAAGAGDGGPAIHTNWAGLADYRRIAAEIDALVPAGASVALDGEVGTLGLLCRCRLLNEFSDPASPLLAAVLAGSGGGLGGAIRDANFAWRGVPSRFDPPRWRLRQGGRSDVALEGAAASWETGTLWAPEGRVVLVRER